MHMHPSRLLQRLWPRLTSCKIKTWFYLKIKSTYLGPMSKYIFFTHCKNFREGYSVFETAHISEGETLFQESKGFNQTLPLVLIIHGMDHGADCYAVNGIIRGKYILWFLYTDTIVIIVISSFSTIR